MQNRHNDVLAELDIQLRREVTDPMKKLLNRAFNFAILPLKLNITEVLVDFNRYSRAIIRHEYWHGKEEVGEHFNPILKKQNNNLPKKYSSPLALKAF